MKWECPNGDECQYRHSLPKDYILKTKQDKMQEEMTIEEFTNLEEQIDEERVRVSKDGRPVNQANYDLWRKLRDEQRAKLRSIKEREMLGKATGIQIFKNSNIVINDAEGAEDLKIEDVIDIDVANDIVKNDEFFKHDKDLNDGMYNRYIN